MGTKAKRGRADPLGDALPTHAIARIGTERFASEVAYACLAWSPDGEWLAGGGYRGALEVWTRHGQRIKGARIAKTRTGDQMVRSVAFTPSASHVLFSADGTIAMLELRSSKIVRTLGPFGTFGPAFAVAPDGQHIVCTGQKGAALIELESGREVRALPAGGYAFVFLPGQRLAVIYDILVRIVDLASGSVLHEISTAKGRLSGGYPSARLLADGRHLVHAGCGGATLIDVERGEAVALEAWPDEVVGGREACHRAIRLDGRIMVRDERNGLRCFDVRTGELGPSIARVGGALALTADDAVLAAGGRLFDGEGRELAPALRRMQRLLGFRGEHIAWTDEEDVLRWSTASGEDVRAWSVPGAEPWDTDSSGARITARERECAATHREEGHRYWMRVFDDGGRVRAELWNPGRHACVGTMSPDATLDVASDLATGTVFLRDLRTGERVRDLARARGTVYGAAFSSAGMLALGAGNGEVQLFDVATGAGVATLRGHRKLVWAVCFSPDGTQLASGGDDRDVRIWDIATGACARVLSGLRSVRGIAWSPDGALVAAGDESKTIVWSADRGDEIVALKGSGWTLSFGPDSRTLVGGGRRAALVWDLGALARAGMAIS